jgi:heat shock protein HtpX
MNAFKTTLGLTALTLVLLFLGQMFGGQTGLTMALFFAVIMNGGAYFFSDRIAIASSGAQPVTREQAPRLYQIVERLAAKANLPAVPQLYVIPEQAPNAFATGRNPRHARVAVTAGLLEYMNDDEIEGVLAHELSHVRNYDILTSSIAATLAGAITWLAQMGRFAMFFGLGGSRDEDDRGSSPLVALLMLFLAPMAAMLLQLMISRRREFAADESAARIVGHPYGLISALEKLGAYNKRIPMDATPSTAPLYIVAPLSGGSIFSSLFSTHPPLEERIAALRGMVIAR